MSIANLCYFTVFKASKLMVDMCGVSMEEKNMRKTTNQSEDLDTELYGHLCPEVEWLSDAEKEQLLNGDMEKEMTEDGMAKR